VIRLEFSPESELDLMEIAAFIARDNPARARSFEYYIRGQYT